MKVFSIQDNFGLENLKVETRRRPRPGPGQILVRIEAVSLNYRDLLVVGGDYNPRWSLPLVPCSDAVGIVTAVGPGVTRFARNDRVCPIFAQDWIAGPASPRNRASTLGGPLDGTLAEYICLSEEAAVAVPDHLSAAEAACLPCAGVTAWNALVTQGRLKSGDWVLVQGSGGVALWSLLIATRSGARVIAVTSTEKKRRRLEKLGAEHTLNYAERPHWGREVRDLSGGGVDQVVDVGGAETLTESLAAVRMGGQIAVIGNLGGGLTELNLIPVLMGNVRLQGVLVGSRAIFEDFCRSLAAGGYRPVIDRRFRFEQAVAAFERMAARKHFGKIVIEMAG